MEAIEILKASRRLISEGRWCKSMMACDWTGKPVSPFSKEAVSFCALGALNRFGGDIVYGFDQDGMAAVDVVLEAARQLTGGRAISLARFNDTSPSADRVIAAFDLAIEMVQNNVDSNNQG